MHLVVEHDDRVVRLLRRDAERRALLRSQPLLVQISTAKSGTHRDTRRQFAKQKPPLYGGFESG
jgi:hypothetical protein